MKNKVTKIIIFNILICISALGQNTLIDKGSRVLLSTSNGLSDVLFHVYNPPFLAKAIYKDTIQAVNKFPEQLMSSIISTLNPKWIAYNTLGGQAKAEKKEQKYYDFIKSMDRDKNYFELRSKMSFSLGGNDFSIIKFYFHTQELPTAQSGAYVMQKVNNRWYSTSTPNTSDLSLMIMRFQEDKLLTILTGKPNGNPVNDELMAKTSVSGSIDLALLYKEFSNWYTNNDSQKIEYFIDPKAW
jgi:hypothetical protein